MKFTNGSLPGLALAIFFSASCSPDLPTEATSLAPAAAKGGPGAAAYTSVDVGRLLSDVYGSRANDVNDAGDVAGVIFGGGAFAIVTNVVTPLSGDRGAAMAMSNSSPLYVVGYTGLPTQAVKWTIASGVASQPASLDLGGETYGGALGVNDAGAAVGYAGASAAMWGADGTLTSLSPPQGFTLGRGHDINNSGEAILVFSGSSGENARGYLRLASGTLIELPPLTDDIGSYAYGISDVANNMVYIAGNSRTGPASSRAIRWTIDVTTGTITDTQVRQENSQAQGVSNAGGVAGGLQSPKIDAFLWRGADLLTLKPPRLLRNGLAWAISPNGAFVAGEAYSGKVGTNAVLWRILSP